MLVCVRPGIRATLNLKDVLLPEGLMWGVGGSRGCEFIRVTHECEKVMVYQSHIIGNHFCTQVITTRVVTA